MNSASSTVVDGLSAWIYQLGRRQIGPQLVNVAGDICLAIPATFVKRRAKSRQSVDELGAMPHEFATDVPPLTIEQREDLSGWQAEMESFDRF